MHSHPLPKQTNTCAQLNSNIHNDVAIIIYITKVPLCSSEIQGGRDAASTCAICLGLPKLNHQHAANTPIHWKIHRLHKCHVWLQQDNKGCQRCCLHRFSFIPPKILQTPFLHIRNLPPIHKSARVLMNVYITLNPEPRCSSGHMRHEHFGSLCNHHSSQDKFNNIMKFHKASFLPTS